MSKPTISRLASRENVPLSFAQQRLWFLDQFEPHSHAYHTPRAWRLRGDLNVAALQQALNAIVARHEALRTNFVTRNGAPVQLIRKAQPVELPRVDLTDVAVSERDSTLERLLRVEAQRSFVLTKDLMLRVRLFRCDGNEHVLLCTMHHIATDGWSLNVFFEELAQFYNSFASEKALAPNELPIQYADFAAWQRQALQGDVLQQQLAYWRNQLKAAPELLNLPTDRPRPPVQTYTGAKRHKRLPRELVDALRALGFERGATLFMTMLAAWQVLLHRYTSESDISVGVPIAGRKHLETERLIGFFVNTLALRGDLSGDPTFTELLARVSKIALEAFEHDELPFEKLVEELQPERNLSHAPLFQVMFAFQNVPNQTVAMHGLGIVPIDVDLQIAKFDLTLFVVTAGETLETVLEYSSDLFDEATAERVLEHYQTLLAGIVTHPEQRIGVLPLLTNREKHQLLVEWNATHREYPAEKCLHHLFEEQAERTPDALAVVYEEQEWTYRELNNRANQLAHYLQKLGVGSGILAGLCVERSIEMVVALLGILKTGGAYVPLDPSHPVERIQFMLEDAQVAVLLTQHALIEDGGWKVEDSYLQSSIRNPPVKAVCVDRDWVEIEKENDGNLYSKVSAANLAYVIYTSGSTGIPKGVAIHHGGLRNYLNHCLDWYPVAEGRGSLVHSSIAFDATITGLFAPLLVGKAVYLLGETADYEALGKKLRELRDFGLVKITPAHLAILNLQIPPDEAEGLTRAFVIGGESLRAEQIAFWQKNAPATLLFNEYGPTEATVGCAMYEASRWQGGGAVAIGRPIANTQIYLLDSHFQPVPIGVVGEIYIGGAGLARDYLNRPELNAERFIYHSFDGEPAQRLYRTGDLARYLPDGNIEFLGRVDNQVKIRGFRVELGEVEAVLAQHAAVSATAVAVKDDSRGDQQLIAYVVCDRGRVTTGELRQYLRAKLPDYMVPSGFVFLDFLPLTANGKVDRKALPYPCHDLSEFAQMFVAPRNAVEESIAAVWREVLGKSQIGVHDNFFDVGGHSLKATQVVSRLRVKFGAEIPLRHLFEYPTIAQLGEAIRPKDHQPAEPVDVDKLLVDLEAMTEEEAQKQFAATNNGGDTR